jgi:ADP-ribose pyrophosphatase YjhB (NUDIX family)
MQPGHIRPLALAIIQREGDLLVCKYYDDAKGETFYRPLGGSIEFGEYGQEAIRREINEELGVDLADVRYLATLEDIFTYRGQRGHEIVLLYEARLNAPALYRRETLTVHEDGERLTAHWMPLHKFQTSGIPLYPDGLLELLMGKAGTPPGSGGTRGDDTQ